MAQSLQSIESLIKSAFALQVAVRCEEDAEAICQKNGLSFADLLRPFSQLGSQVQLKDVQGHQYTLRNVKVRFSEPQSEPTPDTKLRIMLTNVVQNTTAGKDKKVGPTVQIGGVPTLTSTPWFDQYRITFLENLKHSDHECIRHYVSVLLVVSSDHPTPLEAFSQLYTRQKESEQAKYPKWLTPHLFYYHLLLHDVVEGNTALAHDNFEQIKGVYGAGSCYLLQVNSRAPGNPSHGTPDPWSQYSSLRVADHEVEETDGRFALKFRIGQSKKDKQKERSPIAEEEEPAAPTGQEEPPPQILKPNVREEAILIDSDASNEDLNQAPPPPPPPSEVALGSDPLTQMVSQSEDGYSPKHFVGRYGDSFGSGRRSPSGVGQCLTLEDHNALRSFVQEFVGQRLLPHLEAALKNLNEWVVSRRSVRRSITSMGNRFLKMFGGGNQLNSTVGDDISYAYNSLEQQTRQLGDLAFLLQNYDLAFQTYHSIKKEFQVSGAWMHFAGVVEMCALSTYMMSSVRREVISYLEEAISVYNVTVKAYNFGHRASLFLAEVLKERANYRDLTQLFIIRMTAEDADLRSAMCLEQAAHAFLRINPPMTRKYALHLILAGHRYAKATQRVHSTRAYRQALEVYHQRGWTLAEDYIHFSLARHSFALHHLCDAKQAFECLLSHESAQSPNQQLLNLKEYIYVHRQLLSSADASVGVQLSLEQNQTSQTCLERIQDVPVLPLPFANPQLTRVTFATGISLESLESEWDPQLTKSQQGNVNMYRNRSRSSPARDGILSPGIQDLRDSNVIAESRNRHGSDCRAISSEEWLKRVKQNRGDSSKLVIVGASDYDPTRLKCSREGQWVSLERRAAAGLRGVPRENFKPSVLAADRETENSHMPFCVVNEPVAVVMMLKNPLQVPLHMRRVALTWQFTPRSNEDSHRPGAVSEVLQETVLWPREQRMLTLHITPLKEGDLEVLGFIYNLCVDITQQKGSDSPVQPGSRTNLPSLTVSSRDSLYQKHQGTGIQGILAEGVQGRVEISIQGPRLNSTKEEKASVKYGHDYRLRWIVTSPMPKAVASLSPLPSSLFSGEVCRVGVEVVNCGQVALNSLRLSSDLGQQLLLEEKTVSEGSIYYSTITSPTLDLTSYLRLRCPSPCIELPLPRGRLEPGEGVRSTLLLQGVESGEVPLNLVFYYEPALITASSRISHRVIRHSCCLNVKESLYLRASATHGQLPSDASHADSSNFDVNQLVLTLEAENRCQIVESTAAELRVMQVSCVSRQWSISKLDQKQGVLPLLPGEGGTVLLKASRTQKPAEPDQLCFSDVPLGLTTVCSSQFPSADLFLGSSACRALCPEMAEREGPSRRRGVSSSAPREEMAIIVFWQALVPSGVESTISYGHHVLTVPLPQSVAALSEPHAAHPPSPYDLVKYYLDHPVSYHHDFTTNCLCQIPLNITLQNCCNANVKVVLELLHLKEGAQDTTKSSKHSSSHDHAFLWGSGTCRRHLALEPNSTKTLTVLPHFSQAGVYNLNCLRVLAALEDGSYHTQRWQRTSCISIT